MPSITETLTSPAPYHILGYGTLLGSEIWHSFVGGFVAFRVLPRPQFATLQSGLFPVYFAIQTALPMALALTYPGSNNPLGQNLPSSIGGVLADQNRWSVLAPLAITALTGAANMLYAGPMTTRIMKERKHQETRDGRKSYDPAPHSKEMQRLNKAFGRAHGMSSLLNLISLLATMWYGTCLSQRIQ